MRTSFLARQRLGTLHRYARENHSSGRATQTIAMGDLNQRHTASSIHTLRLPSRRWKSGDAGVHPIPQAHVMQRDFFAVQIHFDTSTLLQAVRIDHLRSLRPASQQFAILPS